MKRTAMKRSTKPMRRTPLRPMSDKRQRESKVYSVNKRAYFDKLRAQQLADGLNPPPNAPWCEVCIAMKWPREPAVDWHHVHSRGNGGPLLQPDEKMLAVSRRGHDYIHEDHSRARRRGWLD